MPSNHLILCHPLRLLPLFFPSIRVFSKESVLHIMWPKDWSFSFSISPFNKYSGLISFKIDWFDLLAVQGTLKSLLQHDNSKASVPLCSAFFMVRLSHPYVTTGKTKALTMQTFVGKVISLLFNTTIWVCLSWQRICLQCRRPGFNPWVGNIPWRRERLPTPVFWPGEFHRLYSPWSRKELDTTELLLFFHFHSFSSVTAFLPRSKHLLISWLQSLSSVIVKPKKNKICHCFHFFPFYLP